MKTIARDWVELAEASFTCLELLNTQKHKASLRIICFHCHQTVKKYLSALQEERGTQAARSCNFRVRAKPLLSGSPRWSSIEPALQSLNRYDEDFTYPGHVATRTDAREALKACRSIRSEIRLSLGLNKK